MFSNYLAEQNVSYTKERLDGFISPAGDDDVTEELLVETQAMFVAGIEEDKGENDVDFDDEKAAVSVSKELKAISIAFASLERLRHANNVVLQAVRAGRRDLRLLRQSSLRQKSIKDYFRAQ